MKNVKDHLKRQDRSTVGVNERTIRWHCNEFFKNKLYQPESRQGKYERHCIYHDEDLSRVLSGSLTQVVPLD